MSVRSSVSSRDPDHRLPTFTLTSGSAVVTTPGVGRVPVRVAAGAGVAVLWLPASERGPGVVAVTSVSGAPLDPAPLFDLVTGFPPDDAVDLTIPMPLSLAIHMTMLESTGHPGELAALKKLHIELARETMRSIQARAGDLTGLGADASPRLRITHIIEQRVPGVNGLRPHIHAYVGTTVRNDGRQTPVDVEQLAALGETDVFPEYRDRLVAGTVERLGLVWGETTWSARELVGPRWLSERTEELRHVAQSCPGPWPRRQIVPGRQYAQES